MTFPGDTWKSLLHQKLDKLKKNTSLKLKLHILSPYFLVNGNPIQTETIRYMHDMIPNPKHELSDNKGLKDTFSILLEKTPAVKGDRAWTEREYNDMQQFDR